MYAGVAALMLGMRTPTTEAPKPTSAPAATTARATTAAPKPTKLRSESADHTEMVDAIVLEGKKLKSFTGTTAPKRIKIAAGHVG